MGDNEGDLASKEVILKLLLGKVNSFGAREGSGVGESWFIEILDLGEAVREEEKGAVCEGEELVELGDYRHALYSDRHPL